MGGFDRKAADLVANWDRFLERECGFYPPKLAALLLDQTTQGIYSAADRGVYRFLMLGVSRFYSRTDVTREFSRRAKKILDDAVTPLDRHLQAMSGHSAILPELPPFPPPVVDWTAFWEAHDGAYPSKIAAAHLRITGQGVLYAHRSGWIRSFLVGRENFFSRRDVVNYWFQGSRTNTGNRPLPRFRGKQISGRI